ncbi:MAG: (d)CMP kinase [Alphaproteobacteria bacterium]|nr:(d)CMP kinase [Alphaproteobacteria bacterium]
MPPKHIVVIAVDGPAASGKGTLAKALAAQLGYAYLDTGALYRIVALDTLKAGGDPAKLEDIAPALEILKHLTPAALTDAALRSPAVAEAAAKVSVIPEVRAAVRRYQDGFTKNPPGNAAGVVLDGRDIGTVVCPAADIKFFVTATPEERARRRFEELKKRDPNLTQETVLKDINGRDHRDSSRKISPLRAAADAHILDTTGLNPAEALDKALGIVRAKFPPAGNDNTASGPRKFKPGA